MPAIVPFSWPLRLKALGNLLNLSTPTGLLIARLGRARVRPGPRGLLLAEGYRLSFPVAGAFTVGNVVLTSATIDALCARVPGTLVHEERHTWQYLLLGTFFGPAYLLATAWSWLRTGDRASHNIFERGAGLVDGGYPDVPAQPLAITLGGARAQVRGLLAATGRRRG